MHERPILFSDPMVRAILSGQKTQTRRVVKPQPVPTSELDDECDNQSFVERGVLRKPARYGSHPAPCPYGQPGDRLWVREAWRLAPDACDGWSMNVQEPCVGWIDYRSGGSKEVKAPSFDSLPKVKDWDFLPHTWRPSIHMPRWACRLVLEIVSVRVERLQNIITDDCIAEGCMGNHPEALSETPFSHFRWLWQSINGDESWCADPWVWVIEFRRVQP